MLQVIQEDFQDQPWRARGLDGLVSYGFPIGPTTWRLPGPAQGSLEDTEQSGMISKYQEPT
jgi:hypothetical protein